MRDENRIDDILNRLKIIWKKYPDLRLTQLIANLVDFKNPAVYYLEDKDFIEALEKMYSDNN